MIASLRFAALSALALAAFGVPAVTHAASDSPSAQVAVAVQLSPAEGAKALVARVVPSHAAQFSVEIIPAAANGHDVFEIESVGDKVVLRGNDGVAVASALNHYLKSVANCHLSWCGDRIELPATLKPVPAKVRVENPHQYRVMFNYCTLNYTCSWWDWKRWERELDFLAMQGVNTPLGVVGLEAVWYDTLLKQGFSDLEARTFLVGPTYFAWQWMTNIENHGGPLPRSWIESHRTMGKQWMNRARELGMTPIRQGFSGYVPREVKKKFPEASVAIQPNWCGFPGSAQLDPLDPLFKKIGRTFMEESVKNFGEGHLWAADPFHESSPPRPGDKYLNDVGTAIFGLMNEVDPKVTWAMQAWSIRKPITDSVPKGRLLVLDLGGARNGFWGHDYVKGQLHNFGGRINLHGDLRDIAENKFAAQAAKDPQCVGMGLFPEAIVQNPVFYEEVYDMMWRDKPVEIAAWLHDYALRRYGVANANTDKAWDLLLNEGPYKRGTSGTESSSMICARPALVVKKSGPNTGFVMVYKPAKLVEALGLLLGEAHAAGKSEAYRYDVVDISRQVLSNLTQEIQKEIRLAYLSKDRAAFDKAVAEFDTVLSDTDKLLATRTEFLYGKWVADARSFGTNAEEKALYEHNAGMLVTIWGPERTPEIFDYSWREWSGLIEKYYRPRWQKFHAFLRTSIDKGDYRDPKAQQYGREALRANDFYKELAEWEIAFNKRPADLPATTRGDALEAARAVYAKYSARLAEIYSDAYRARVENRLNQLTLGLADNEIVAGKWNVKGLKPSGREFTFPAGQSVDADGEYEIVVRATDGKGSLSVGSVRLFLNDAQVAADKGAGKITGDKKETVVRLSSGQNLQNGVYSIKVKLEPATDKEVASGVVIVRKVAK